MSFWQVLRQTCCTDILFVFFCFPVSKTDWTINLVFQDWVTWCILKSQEGRNIATQSFYNSYSVYYKINHCNTCEGRFRRFTEWELKQAVVSDAEAWRADKRSLVIWSSFTVAKTIASASFRCHQQGGEGACRKLPDSRHAHVAGATHTSLNSANLPLTCCPSRPIYWRLSPVTALKVE